MKILGITGGSGTGKSTVSRMLEEKGFYIIDADKVAREIVEVGMPALAEIKEYFGESVIKEDNSLDRRALAGIVFNDKNSLAKLNEITHKYITEEIDKRLSEFGGEWAVIDAPLLFESGIGDKCDLILSVVADYDVRKERIIKRDSLSQQQAEQRINAQKDKQFYIEKSDFVIENNGSEYELKREVEEFAGKLERYSEEIS